MLGGPASSSGIRAQYDVSRDGRRFLLSVPVEDATSSPTITVVVNWMAELER